MASSEHLRVFIGNFITREPSGALCSATSARRTSVLHQCVRQPPEHLRMLTEHLRTLTGSFGLQPEPSGSRTPSGVRRPSSQTLSLSGLVAPVASSDDFGLPPVRYNRHRASSEAHRNLRAPPGSPRDPEATVQSHRLAVIELFL